MLSNRHPIEQMSVNVFTTTPKSLASAIQNFGMGQCWVR